MITREEEGRVRATSVSEIWASLRISDYEEEEEKEEECNFFLKGICRVVCRVITASETILIAVCLGVEREGFTGTRTSV